MIERFTNKEEWLARLRKGKKEMAKRCELIAAEMADEAGVLFEEYTNGLYGRAYPEAKIIRAPRPTTRRRLYIWAHECAHVALEHYKGLPVHRQEYEARRWAIAALRRYGIAVPRKSLLNAKRYVATKIQRALKRGAKRIDPEARAWSLQ